MVDWYCGKRVLVLINVMIDNEKNCYSIVVGEWCYCKVIVIV